MRHRRVAERLRGVRVVVEVELARRVDGSVAIGQVQGQGLAFLDIPQRLSEGGLHELEEIEKQVVQLLSQQSQSDTKIFGKALAPHEVEARLQSCRKTNFLKFKLNWDRVRVWDASGQELLEFGDLAGRSCKVRVEMRQCWLMPPSWGILMEVTDLMLMEAAPPQIQCPF